VLRSIRWVFINTPTIDKKVVGVFVHFFRAPLQQELYLVCMILPVSTVQLFSVEYGKTILLT
jgi:hypothetical protein